MGALLVNPAITYLEVLGADECLKVARRVAEISEAWLTRGPGFSTIGVAAYLDIMCSDRPEETYYARLAAQNQLIEREFGWLLERVRKILSERFGRPARYERSVALPGFHIFEQPGITIHEHDSQHFDLQYRYMRWSFEPSDHDVLSFTLAIELPRLGGGLDVWSFTEHDLRRLERLGRRPEMGQLGRTKPHVRYAYSPGSMLVQLQPIMHRIAPIPRAFEGDRRLTLQGHAVADGDHLVLYW